MARIWLNHWFSTAYNIINLIREGCPSHVIIGSNEQRLSPIMAVCDEWFPEPVLSDDDYVDYCVNFCVEHSIDVFLPRRHMVAISKHKHRFVEIGVLVMVDDYELVSLLNNKARAYEMFSDLDIVDVPAYRVGTNAKEFADAYAEFSLRYRSVCFKFISDEGGKSYRRIDERAKGYETLFKKQTTRITFENAYGALSERESFPPLMVMPYLPDEEISVDCLMTADGLIAIPRIKTASRVEKIEFDPEIISSCERILESLPLQQPCNIQFKKMDGVPYLLEINTRMSGGTHMACAGAGVNIPSIAVNKLLGVHETWYIDRADHYVTQAEIPISL